MPLTLAVETSSINYGVALRDGPQPVAARTLRRDDPSFVSIGILAAELLEQAGVAVHDLARLAVDVGPGNLGSVRAGIAYVNGLAFSRDIAVVSVDALRLLSAAATRADGQSNPGEPVLSVRHAGAGQVFAGLFGPGGARFRFGPFATVVPELVGELPELAVAGVLRAETAAALPHTRVKDTGVEFPDVLTLSACAAAPGVAEAAVATPVTESAAMFEEA